MKKIIITAFMLVLCGCSSPNIKIDNIQDAVANKAMQQKAIARSYDKEDIQIVKVCKAVKKDKVSEFDGKYIVFWKTKDDKFNREFLYDDGEIKYGVQNYKVIKEKCIEN